MILTSVCWLCALQCAVVKIQLSLTQVSVAANSRLEGGPQVSVAANLDCCMLCVNSRLCSQRALLGSDTAGCLDTTAGFRSAAGRKGTLIAYQVFAW